MSQSVLYRRGFAWLQMFLSQIKKATLCRLQQGRQRILRTLEVKRLASVASQTCELYGRIVDTPGASRTAVSQCRELLEMPLSLSSPKLERFFQTAVGRQLLQQLSTLIDWPADALNQIRLRDALTDLVSSEAGFSLLSLLYRLSQQAVLRVDRLLPIAMRTDSLLRATEKMVSELSQLTETPAPSSAPLLSLRGYTQISRPGSYPVRRDVLIVKYRPRCESSVAAGATVEASAQLRTGRAIVYRPERWRKGGTPVVIISHGLASSPENLTPHAQHLASHGYYVALPQHPGSDLAHLRRMLAGEAQELFHLQEFFYRPWDVTAILDELERLNLSHYGQQLNLRSVGVLGQSFGSYTALTLVGASVDLARLQRTCQSGIDPLNLSMLLQCRALDLNAQPSLKDERVQAVLALDPVGSGLFDLRQLSQIDIPVMMVAGSGDRAAPMVFEAIQLFTQLQGSEQSLVVIEGKPHSYNLHQLLDAFKLTEREQPQRSHVPPLIAKYIYGLSLLFFEHALVGDCPEPLSIDAPSTEEWDFSKVTADYVHFVSERPHPLYFATERSRGAIATALQTLQQQLGPWPSSTQAVTHQEDWFVGADGLELYYQQWQPAQLEGVVILIHGLGEHSRLFSNVANRLTAAGYGVYALDLRGHGRSPGPRGYTDSWATLCLDLELFWRRICPAQPAVPCYLMGQGVGGLLALTFAHQHSAGLAGLAGLVIADAPVGQVKISLLNRLGGCLFSRLWPTFPLSLGRRQQASARGQAVALAQVHDRLRHRCVTARLLAETSMAARQLFEQADALQVPLLMLYGSTDSLNCSTRAAAYFDQAGSAYKRWRSYDSARCALLTECHDGKILDDILAWIEQTSSVTPIDLSFR
ncbi:MAG: alpha/beta fold hydrolase [Cyanobacteria bacterium J06554_6]